jgi:hypothetical protein
MVARVDKAYRAHPPLQKLAIGKKIRRLLSARHLF